MLPAIDRANRLVNGDIPFHNSSRDNIPLVSFVGYRVVAVVELLVPIVVDVE
jgi:hypothetical protein